MPRSISSPFKTHLAGGLLTLATLVLVTRKDGVALGFTDHNKPITFDGVTYEPTDGVSMTSISQKSSSSPSNTSFSGILSSGRITDSDLINGVYQSAQVLISIVNWADLTMGAISMESGFIGNVTVSDAGYEAELRGLEQLLKQNTGDLFSGTCRVKRLFDLQCRANSSGSSTGVSDVQTLTFVGQITSGYFNLTFAGATTSNIAWNANAATIQSALQALSTIGSGNVIVTGGPVSSGTPRQPIVITFSGSKANIPQTSITVTQNLGGTGVNVTIAHTTVGVAAGLPFRVSATVASIIDSQTFTFTIGTSGNWTWSAFGSGLVTWLTGNNAGFTREISTPGPTTGVTIANPLQLPIRIPLPFAVSVGDTVTLEQGCDRKYTTCQGKMNNSINFHGEPLLIGNDNFQTVGR